MKKLIPNAITLINLLSGCMAIMCATAPLDVIGGHPAYMTAFCFILLASVADFMDGLSARMLDRYSPLGKQLDSNSNIDATQSRSFKGLPIPAAALFCIGLASLMASEGGVNLLAAVGCIIAVSLLMVVPVRMYSSKVSDFSLKANLLPLSLVAVAVVCICVWGWTGLFFAVGYYVLSAFIASTFVQIREGA